MSRFSEVLLRMDTPDPRTVDRLSAHRIDAVSTTVILGGKKSTESTQVLCYIYTGNHATD